MVSNTVIRTLKICRVDNAITELCFNVLPVFKWRLISIFKLNKSVLTLFVKYQTL